MFKKVLAVVLTASLLLTGCNNTTVEESSTATPVAPPYGETQTDYVFEIVPQEDAIYKMMLEPTPNSIPKDSFYVSVLNGYDANWIADDDWTSVYNLFDEETETEYGRLTLTTTPPDLKAHFGVTTDEEVQNELLAQIFTTQNVHDGLLTGARDDFGYTILTDIMGTSNGYTAFFIEFLNEETNNHAMRFYLSNDEINENHVALAINCNIPADETQLIEDFRSMLFSLQKVK